LLLPAAEECDVDELEDEGEGFTVLGEALAPVPVDEDEDDVAVE
jgi:hypothetical protein